MSTVPCFICKKVVGDKRIIGGGGAVSKMVFHPECFNCNFCHEKIPNLRFMPKD
jgi:hypothetical protein